MNNRLKHMVFTAVMLLCVFVVLELFSYIYMLKIRDNPLGSASERHNYSYFRGHELNPEYYRPFDTNGVKIHSPDGFRQDAAVSIKKPDDVYRIILFGGSQAYGVGSQAGGVYVPEATLANDQTVSHFLEQSLNEVSQARAGKRVEVINAAVVAYKAYQHLLYFNERLYQYDADLLLFVDGHNDYYSDKIERNPMLANVYAKDLVWNFNNRSFTFSVYSMARVLGEYSYFFKFLEKSLQKIVPIVSPYQAPIESTVSHDLSRYPEYALNSYLRIYQQFKALQPLYGFEMRIIIQPQILLEQEALLSDHDKAVLSITQQYADQELMQNIHAKLPGIFEAAELEFNDFTAIADKVDNTADLYYDYTHLSPAGSEVLADNISLVVQSSVFSTPAQTLQ